MKRFFKLSMILFLQIFVACNGENDPEESADLGDLTGEIPQSPAEPMCVWNNAYQENYDSDSLEEILENAQNCYVLIDPFDNSSARDAISELKNAGNTIGCYISIGTCEEWRDDFDSLRFSCTTEEWSDWEGEFFVNDPEAAQPFMIQRIQTLASWGCDMVEFDNMDFAGESERFGLNVTEEEGDLYANALCNAVHDANMRCMAKNYAPSDENNFDGGTFESSSEELDWWNHEHMQHFVDEGFPTIVFHYDERRCEEVTKFYRLRYGSGVSVLCEDPDIGCYLH